MSRIVVGADGSPRADRALRWAVREATVRDAEIELVHGYVLHPHAAMIGRSDRLLVMGTRGRNALGRAVFGSVTHQCLHHARGPGDRRSVTTTARG